MVCTVARVLPVLVLALAACGGKPPPPAPLPAVNACPAAPRVVAAAELGARIQACGDDACVAALRAEYADAVVAVSDVIDEGAQKRARSRGAITELAALRDDACACKNAACAATAQDGFEAWATRYADTNGSQAEADQAAEIAEELSACLVKATKRPKAGKP